MESIEKNVVKTSLITLCVMLATLIVTIFVLCIFFPKTMCNLTNTLGMKNLALHFSEKQYQKSQDINDLHSTIYLAIDIEKNEKISKYCDIIFKKDDFNAFIDYINAKNINNAPNLDAKLAVSNESNYLKNQYVKALCNLGQKEKAIAFTKEEFVKEQQWTVDQKTQFPLSQLLIFESKQSTPNYSFMKEQCQNAKTLMWNCENYICNILNEYNKIKTDTSKEWTAQCLKYELTQYLNTILFLNGKVDYECQDYKYYNDAKANL